MNNRRHAPYSNQEYYDMVFVYRMAQGNANEASRIYAAMFPNNRHPTAKTILATVNRFQANANFRITRERERHPLTLQRVLNLVEQDPTTSCRKIERISRIPKSTVNEILVSEGFHGYHYQPVQKLIAADLVSRRNFCEGLQELDDGDLTINKILWTDESYYTKDGCFNYRNCHSYARENPRLVRVANTQQRFSLNTWCGIINNKVIGPHFFEENLNGAVYLNFLENILPGLIENADENIDDIIYQHDGAPRIT